LKDEDKDSVLEDLINIQQVLAVQVVTTTGNLANQHIKRAERAIRAAIEALNGGL